PSGRRWPEGPDEGAFPALTRRFAPPSQRERDISGTGFQIENPMKTASLLLLQRNASGNLDKSAPRGRGTRTRQVAQGLREKCDLVIIRRRLLEFGVGREVVLDPKLGAGLLQESIDRRPGSGSLLHVEF